MADVAVKLVSPGGRTYRARKVSAYRTDGGPELFETLKRTILHQAAVRFGNKTGLSAETLMKVHEYRSTIELWFKEADDIQNGQELEQ